MKGFTKKSKLIAAFGLIGVLTVWITWTGLHINHTGKPNLTVTQALASEKGLEAGMIDPKTGKKIKYWAAPMDPTYIRNQPGKSPMGMDLVPVYEEAGQDKEPASTIRIDPVTIQNMGVRLARVKRKPLVKYIRTFGNITYDERLIYTVNTKFNGWIEKLYVNFVGETLKKGQPLFGIYSPELVTAQEEYLLALEHNARLKDSPYTGIREGAQRLLDASRTRLKYWDLNDKQIKKIETTGNVQKTLTIYSPAKGVVINIQRCGWMWTFMSTSFPGFEMECLPRWNFPTSRAKSLPVTSCTFIRFLRPKPVRLHSDWNFPIPIFISSRICTPM
ncbi:MAG: efflux RND transporter periplasmic adaptor subunit [Deltaproteobacteria bacterium]|nr:efflux RND transporter periplasmic adaptor subunit [Deltaproteobacteria bacterium]